MLLQLTVIFAIRRIMISTNPLRMERVHTRILFGGHSCRCSYIRLGPSFATSSIYACTSTTYYCKPITKSKDSFTLFESSATANFHLSWLVSLRIIYCLTCSDRLLSSILWLCTSSWSMTQPFQASCRLESSCTISGYKSEIQSVLFGEGSEYLHDLHFVWVIRGEVGVRCPVEEHTVLMSENKKQNKYSTVHDEY